MDKRWAQSPGRRDQLVLFAQSLDDLVATNHPIRVLEACLEALDWSAWEQRYASHRGQPPVHPMRMAGCLLYGLMRGLRSARALEDATRERVDFMWFLEGRTIDHSTFANFRGMFEGELKGLNRQISKAVCEGYEEALLTLILDGTRIRANSERNGARTAEGLERLIASCTKALNERLDALAEQEGPEALEQQDVATLEAQAAALEAQLATYQRALEVARTRDAAKVRQQGGRPCHAARVPLTDPASSILPNKEGGFAPNYTPVVAVDQASGCIVESDVVSGADEGEAVAAMAQACEKLGGRKPERLLADSAFGDGTNLAYLESQGIKGYIPMPTEDFRPSNPAHRPDPTQPVPEEQWTELPRHGKCLARSAFIYDEENDRYHCPMGRSLSRRGRGRHTHNGASYIKYRCPGREGCPLAAECIKGHGAARSVSRDEYQYLRERMGKRMATERAQEVYKKRAPLVEGVFAVIKHVMGVRQFLLRGLERVRIEWAWICGAFNLKKLLSRGLFPRRSHGVFARETRGPVLILATRIHRAPAHLLVPLQSAVHH